MAKWLLKTRHTCHPTSKARRGNNRAERHYWLGTKASKIDPRICVTTKEHSLWGDKDFSRMVQRKSSNSKEMRISLGLQPFWQADSQKTIFLLDFWPPPKLWKKKVSLSFEEKCFFYDKNKAKKEDVGGAATKVLSWKKKFFHSLSDTWPPFILPHFLVWVEKFLFR